MKLRLLMFEKCNRSCEGCCNNDFDLDNLPVVGSFAKYSLIMLTGGEPMLRPELVLDTVNTIRRQTSTAIFLYTAKTKRPWDLLAVLQRLEGLTLTLHEQYDVPPFNEFNRLRKKLGMGNKSLRLNVFKGVDISTVDTREWRVKSDITWIKDCPLPTNEVLMRL